MQFDLNGDRPPRLVNGGKWWKMGTVLFYLQEPVRLKLEPSPFCPLSPLRLVQCALLAISLLAGCHIGGGDRLAEEIAASEQLVALDFSATWCPPCRRLAPILSQLSAEYAGRVRIITIDVDANRQLTSRYGVHSFPTVILFKDRYAVGRNSGCYPIENYRAWFDPYLKEPIITERKAGTYFMRFFNIAGPVSLLLLVVMGVSRLVTNLRR